MVSDVQVLSLVKWGPKQTTVGVVVNKQPYGESAFWIQMVEQKFYCFFFE
jgi:hypothetical protein